MGGTTTQSDTKPGETWPVGVALYGAFLRFLVWFGLLFIESYYTVTQELLQPKTSCSWLFEPVSFIWDQDKRFGVGGSNIYLGIFGVLAPETGYTYL